MQKMNRYLKNTLKTLGLATAGLLLFIGVYLLAAYGLSRISVHEAAAAQNGIPVYILTNGVHTDLVLPIRTEQIDWSREIRFDHTLGKDTAMQYVALGWGDKGFYLETPTWAELKFTTAFKAAFALSTSAIHATFYRELKEGPDCVKLQLSAEDYARLVTFVRNSFTPGPDGHFIPIATSAVYGKNDTFYEARGSYSLFRTCNTWANDGLKSCGQKACLWTAFDTGIFYHYAK